MCADITRGSGAGVVLPEGTITVLFTDLVESTQLNQRHGDEVANGIRRDVENCALELIERHQGVVVKGLGDGLMVAFQSARRAVACARAIQLALANRNRDNPAQRVTMRIGLHTGEVITDSHDLHGETVIIAKRIEGVAPSGGIYASATVHGVLGTARAELVDRGDFELKGIEAPWHLYEVPLPDERSAVLLADSDRSPYVGRARERELLAGFVARAAGGLGGMVLISGEAGAGKSRLAQETADLARRHQMAVLVGHCLDMDAPPPYQPFVEQLGQSARALASEEFRELLGDNAPEVARLMPELYRIYPDIGDAPGMPPDQERQYLLHALSRFVERATLRQPLVLCFEDLHWADEASLLLITALAQIAGELPLLLIGSYRPGDIGPGHPLSRACDELARNRLATEIRLTALAEADVGLLLAGRAGQPPPAALVSVIYDQTEGNPFFVEEVFLHLKERGVLFDDKGRWHDEVAVTDIDVPRTVRLVIERRLERIGEDVRKALTAAAVAGRTASFELLLATAGLEENLLLDALDEAEHASFIRGQDRAGEVIYSFVHENIRQTVLANLSVPRRQRLHVRVADALQESLGTKAEQRAADIAHHLQLAGTAAPRDRTIHYLELAARNAIAAVAPEDAVRSVDAALELLGDTDGALTAGLLAVRARANRMIPRMDDALADLAAALRVAPAGAPREAVLRQRAGLHLDRFDGQAASDDLAEVLDAVRARGDRPEELDTLLALARAHYVRSLDDQAYAPIARTTCEQAYEFAAAVDDRRAMIDALMLTMWFTDYWIDYTPIARANIDKAVRLAAELGDERLSIETQSAALARATGTDVAESAERLRQRLEALHDPVRLKEFYYALMWQYLSRAELHRCVETCDLGIGLARQLGSAPVQYGSIKALALTELGRYDLVDAALDEEVTDDAHPFGQANQALARANYLAALEAWEPAAAAALDAMKRAAGLSRIWMQDWLLAMTVSMAARAGEATFAETAQIEAIAEAAGLEPKALARAEASLSAGHAKDARDLLEPQIASLAETDSHLDLAQALECLGRALIELGHWEEALAAADRGLSLTTRSGQLPLTWKFRVCRARALAQLGRTNEAEQDRGCAAADFELLASRIHDPELRGWFDRQPLATLWLSRSSDSTAEEVPN